MLETGRWRTPAASGRVICPGPLIGSSAMPPLSFDTGGPDLAGWASFVPGGQRPHTGVDVDVVRDDDSVGRELAQVSVHRLAGARHELVDESRVEAFDDRGDGAVAGGQRVDH